MATGRVIRSLLVRLGVKTDTKGLARFNKGLGSIKRGMAVVGAGAVVVSGAIVKMTLDAARAGDQLGKDAKRYDIAASSLQELAFVAERGGTSLGVLLKGLKKQSTFIFELSRGTKTYTEIADQLNVSYADLKALKPEDQFTLMADRLGTLTDSTKQQAIASQLWGRAGIELLSIINDEATSIADLRAEAQRIGFVMSDEMIAQSELLQDNILDNKLAFVGLRNTLSEVLLPEANRLLNWTKEMVVADKDLIKSKVAEWAEKIVDGVQDLWQWFKRVDDFVQKNIGGWGPILKVVLAIMGVIALVTIAAPFITAAAGIASMIAAGTTAVLVIGGMLLVALGLAEAFTASFLVVDDIMTFLRGGDSVLGRWVDKITMFLGKVKQITGELDQLKQIFDLVQVVTNPIGFMSTQIAGDVAAGGLTSLRGLEGSKSRRDVTVGGISVTVNAKGTTEEIATQIGERVGSILDEQRRQATEALAGSEG